MTNSQSRSRRWCFTLNNYTAEEQLRLLDSFESPSVVYGVFGREIAPETHTPHLQGFIIFSKTTRFNAVKSLIGDRAHLECARGTSASAADYCKKDGDFDERGDLPDKQGKRNDLDSFFAWATEFGEEHERPPTRRECACEYPRIMGKYPRCYDVAVLRADTPKLQLDNELRLWQSELLRRLEEEPDDRTVLFVLDKEGNKGKTWFIRHYMSNHDDAQVIGVGKTADMALAVDESKRVFFFNIPRTKMQFVQYDCFEQLKDRMVWSPKYDSRMKYLYNKCHVVVMCNEMPDMDKMSADRYVFLDI